MRAGPGNSWSATAWARRPSCRWGVRATWCWSPLGDEQPDMSTLAAFAVAGHQAVTLRAGTWHHGLIAPQGGDFVVIERQAETVDCELATLAIAVTLD